MHNENFVKKCDAHALQHIVRIAHAIITDFTDFHCSALVQLYCYARNGVLRTHCVIRAFSSNDCAQCAARIACIVHTIIADLTYFRYSASVLRTHCAIRAFSSNDCTQCMHCAHCTHCAYCTHCAHCTHFMHCVQSLLEMRELRNACTTHRQIF